MRAMKNLNSMRGDRVKMVVTLKNLEKNYNYKEEWTPISQNHKTLRLYLINKKFKEKYERKKIQRKIKNRLKVNKLLCLLLQTHFIYINSLI